MTKRPHIFITNDDGIHAPGIRYLADALSTIADITIVAPAIEQSLSSLSITIRSPLRIEEVSWKNNKPAWSVNGTPADCVKLGLNTVFKQRPDLIVSGINHGSNAGRNILYSGTVGGVIEGTMQEIPGIAFSCLDSSYHAAVPYIPAIAEHALAHPLPAGTFLNVNFPSQPKGIKLTRQGKSYWKENPDKRSHPEGHEYYWMGGQHIEFDEHEESDIAWLSRSYATVVPVQVGELTDHKALEERKGYFEQLARASDEGK